MAKGAAPGRQQQACPQIRTVQCASRSPPSIYSTYPHLFLYCSPSLELCIIIYPMLPDTQLLCCFSRPVQGSFPTPPTLLRDGYWQTKGSAAYQKRGQIILLTYPPPTYPRAAALNLWATHQRSCVSDIYITTYSNSKITVMKKQ